VESELSFHGGILDGRSRTDNATWVDGLVGFKGTYAITPEVYLTGWGLVGAGGADLDWDVAAAIGYRFPTTSRPLPGTARSGWITATTTLSSTSSSRARCWGW